MASLSLARGPARPAIYNSSRCVIQTTKNSQRATRRWIGTKYLAKIADAELKWQERALDIRAGGKKSMLDILEERGLVEQVTGTREEVNDMLIDDRLGAYVGIDPTAASLHVGHMLPLMTLFWMYVHGYHAVTLLGGSTAKFGDPTGRTTAREPVHRTVRVQNMASMHFQLKKLWLNVEAYALKYDYKWEWAWKRALVNNNTWLGKLTWVEALSIIGYTPTSPMFAKRTVKNKLSDSEQGLTYAELSYPLMQAWDWWHMYNTMGVRVQIGGSDQYGNITAGAKAVKHIAVTHPSPELPKRTTKPAFGLTTPLLTTSSGAKFGKSAGNAIWLDENMTSPYDLYKYFLGTSDADVGSYLKKFTFMPIGDIDKLVKEHMEDASKRKAQHKLAFEFVELIHGVKVAEETQAQHHAIFQKPAVDASGDLVGASALREAQVNLNNRPRAQLKLPRTLIETKSIGKVLHACGLADSASEGHRLASLGGAWIGAGADRKKEPMRDGAVNWNPIKTWKPEETKNFLVDDSLLLLRRGKANVRFIEVVEDEEYEKLGLRYPGDGKGPIDPTHRSSADLTQKHSPRLPSVVAASAPKPEANYRPAWTDMQNSMREDALEEIKEAHRDAEWGVDGSPRLDKADRLIEDNIGPAERLEMLRRQFERDIQGKQLKFEKKHAPKGKFMGHGLPRGPAPGEEWAPQRSSRNEEWGGRGKK